MAESESHKRAKRKAAGKSGKTETPLKGGGHLDARKKITATEIERSGTPRRLEAAARRLKRSRKRQRVLVVPQRDMDKAVAAMKKVGTTGTVKNMSGTKRRQARPKKS